MFLSQIHDPLGNLAVAAREGSEAAIVKGAASVYALAIKAAAAGLTLAKVVAGHGLGEAVDLAAMAAAGRLVQPLTHPIRRTCI